MDQAGVIPSPPSPSPLVDEIRPVATTGEVGEGCEATGAEGTSTASVEPDFKTERVIRTSEQTADIPTTDVEADQRQTDQMSVIDAASARGHDAQSVETVQSASAGQRESTDVQLIDAGTAALQSNSATSSAATRNK